jgi:alpha-L-fucosidase
MKKIILCLFAMKALFVEAQQQTDPASIRGKMQWFADAKLGIFIHWGLYSVKGVDDSWTFYNKMMPYAEYMGQLKGFTASKWDPEQWADLIKESGARYAVLTTKHHEGMALWGTKLKHYNTVDNTPAKRDLLTPFYAAIRARGIKAGAYFSMLDWSHPDYPGFLKDSSRYKVSDDPARWDRFRKFYQGQITELSKLVNPDLWWFDGDWEHSEEEWEAKKVRSMILADNPSAIINGRLMGYGDYDTPEQNFPVARPAFNWWELCMTTNNSWGYHPSDTAYKTPYEVITIFADVVGNGGNLLLDIGPREDGTIPKEQVSILKELGSWNRRNGEAVFGTLGGIPQGHFYGPTTLSRDSSTLFLFLSGNPSTVVVKGLVNKVSDISVLGSTLKPALKVVGKISWSPVPGLIYIYIPKGAMDKYMTVLKVKLDGPVRLYGGK